MRRQQTGSMSASPTSVRRETLYFARPGTINTARVLHAAVDRARLLNIHHIVVASTSGRTALRLAQMADTTLKIVCITHHAGFRKPGEIELSGRNASLLAARGIPILRTTHLMAGLDRAVRLLAGGMGPAEIVANTYRTFGEGTKVAVEAAVMALDAGLIPARTDVIAIGGTSSGADTALVVCPAHAKDFFRTTVKEVICKPRIR